MKHYSFLTALLLVWAYVSAQAKPFQPVYFDDPTQDIHSDAFSPEQRSFFDRYVYAMEQIAQGASAEEYFVMEHAAADEEVAPLLGNINFNQGKPYNNHCPVLDGGRAVTGCVATAMAQVMRYYQYPVKGTGTFTYTGGEDGARTINLEDYPFDWANILEEYQTRGYSTEQADAVANLMLMCGASLSMSYSKDGSGADLAKVDGLLKNNFSYSREVRFVSTQGSSNPDEVIESWGEDVVRPELEAGHPLLFAGFPAIGQTGHCFVIDGYKVIDGAYYYHVNWGWGGQGNSYCLLTELRDEGGSDYSGYNLQMVYYIYPEGWQGIEDVQSNDVQCTKVIRNGQLIIERNHVQYNVQGTRVN